MKLNPYLAFDGQCEAAFKFYEQALGAKILMMLPYGGSPMAGQCPAEWQGKIMHARLAIGDFVIMGSDTPPDRFDGHHGFMINIGTETAEEAERLFKVLSEQGTIGCPLAETFWAVRFGMVTDKFGIHWMVNCEKPSQG